MGAATCHGVASMSWQGHLLNGFLRMSKRYFANRDAATAVATMRLYMNRLAGLQILPSSVQTRADTIGGVACEWVWAAEAADCAGVIEYFHGGGFVAGGPASHRDLAWRLSRASGRRVLLVDYRLAPEFPYPAQLNDAVAVYRGLLARGVAAGSIALAGDSAGGNLVLATALALRAAALPLPGALLAFSPWADLSHSGASIGTNAAADTMIPPALLARMAELYRGGAAVTDPLVSPLFGDFRGLPPLLVHAAAQEVLCDDALRVVAAAQAAGVEAECRLWPRVPHAFPVFAQLLPEARTALRQSGAFLQHYLDAATAADDAACGATINSARATAAFDTTPGEITAP